MHQPFPFSQFKLGEFRWAFMIIFVLAFVVFSAAYISGFNSNITLFILALMVNLYIALVDIKKGITLFFVMSFIYGLLNRVTYNFSAVDFNFLYAYPQFALFGISLIALIQHIQNHKFRFNLYLLDKIILIFLAWSMLQALNPNQSLIISLYGIRFRIVPVFLYFLARIYIKNESDLKHLYRLLILLTILTAAYGIFQRAFGLPDFEFVWIKAFPNILIQKTLTQGGGQGGWYNDGVLRFFSTFSGGNEFNYIMAFLLIFLLGFNPIRKNRRWIIARLVAILLITTVILLTRERTPIAMIAVGLAVHLLLRIYPSISRLFLIAFLMISLLVLSFLITAYRESVINILGGDLASLRLVELANPLQADTVSHRIEKLWIPSLELISENPIGYGIGASRYSRATREEQLLITPHSTYLEIGLELGVIGFVVFSLILVESIRWIFALRPKCRQFNNLRFLPDSILGVIAAALACALISTVFLDTAGNMVWFFIGLVPVTSRLSKKTTRISQG